MASLRKLLMDDVPEEPDSRPRPLTLREAMIDSGWGPKHDQPNPFVRTAKKLATDVRETFQDLRDEPGELGYRIRERAQSYLPAGVRIKRQR